MKKGYVEVYCGSGRGKTSLALGQSLKACAEKKSVIIIQFLKGKEKGELNFLEKADVDVKVFRFEKSEKYYDELNEEERQEQKGNIRNGLNYARKVLQTHECDLLVLDEILGLPEHGIATWEEIGEILSMANCNIHLVLTGRNYNGELKEYVNEVTKLETEVFKEISIDSDCE